MRLIDAQAAEQNFRLPPIRAMASRADVSVLTMWRAAQQLVREEVIDIRQGSGVWLKGHAPSRALTNAESPPAWQKAKTALERDIAEGDFRFDQTLPSTKELAARYAVAYRTIRKALVDLCERGVLKTSGRSFRVSIEPRHSRDTIILLARGGRDGALELPTPRMEQQLRVIHGECARAGVTLKAYGAGFALRGLTFAPEAELAIDGRGKDAILGYILWSTSLPYDGVVALLRRLAASGKPVSLLDEGGEYTQRSARDRSPLLAVFATSFSSRCGVHMGQFLRARGWKRAVYLTLWPGVLWSIRREKGLREAFAVDKKDCVTTISPELDCPDYTEPLDRLDRVLATLAAQTRERDPAFTERFHRALSASSANIQSLIYFQQMELAAQPLYEKAIAQQSGAVWVAANDLIALGALRFLRARGAHAPVVGFDDTPEAFAAQLTSYSFNLPAIAHAMLHHILNPRAKRPGAPPVVEIDGYVNERSSA